MDECQYSRGLGIAISGIKPATAGSKKFVGVGRNGKGIIIDTCKSGKSWRRILQKEAKLCMQEEGNHSLFSGPINLEIIFTVPRPKKHFNKKGLKQNAPLMPTTRPDLTKLVRAVEDALTNVVWGDDRQICSCKHRKEYAELTTNQYLTRIFVGKMFL